MLPLSAFEGGIIYNNALNIVLQVTDNGNTMVDAIWRFVGVIDVGTASASSADQ